MKNKNLKIGGDPSDIDIQKFCLSYDEMSLVECAHERI